MNQAFNNEENQQINEHEENNHVTTSDEYSIMLETENEPIRVVFPQETTSLLPTHKVLIVDTANGDLSKIDSSLIESGSPSNKVTLGGDNVAEAMVIGNNSVSNNLTLKANNSNICALNKVGNHTYLSMLAYNPNYSTNIYATVFGRTSSYCLRFKENVGNTEPADYMSHVIGGITRLFVNPNTITIGGNTKINDASLNLSETNKYFLPNRLTTAQRDLLVSPTTGAVIYNTTDNAFNYFDGSAWKNLVTGENLDSKVTKGGDINELVIGTSTNHNFRIVRNGLTQLNFWNNGLFLYNHLNFPSSGTSHRITHGTTGIEFIAPGNTNRIFNSTLNAVYGTGLLLNNIGGSTTIDANASLELAQSNKYFLPNRLTTAQRDALVSPAAGAVIYNTTDNAFSYYDGSAWKNLITSESLTNKVTKGGDEGELIIGTTTNNNILLRRNNQTLVMVGPATNIYFYGDINFPASTTTRKIAHGNTGFEFQAGGNTNRIFTSSLNVQFSTGVTIGGTTINANASLELAQSNKYFLPNRLTTVQRDALVSPVAGAFIFNVDTNCHQAYDGSTWINCKMDSNVLVNGGNTGNVSVGSKSGSTSILSNNTNILTVGPTGVQATQPVTFSTWSANETYGPTKTILTKSRIGTLLNITLDSPYALNYNAVTNQVRIGATVAPTGDNDIYNALVLEHNITQPETANGTIRGIYINPTINQIKDYRAVDINNNAGYAIYQPNNGAKNLFAGEMRLTGVQEYADNAAALSAGLTIGTVYRTGDNLKIVH